LGVEWTV